MKPAAIRKSVQAMLRRWERDLERLEFMFPLTDWGDGDDATEVMRNLGTAIRLGSRYFGHVR